MFGVGATLMDTSTCYFLKMLDVNLESCMTISLVVSRKRCRLPTNLVAWQTVLPLSWGEI